MPSDQDSPPSRHTSSPVANKSESQPEQEEYPAEVDFGPDPRIIIFYISLPDPVALPGATTFSQFLDESVAELENAPISLTPDDEPFPEEVSGKLFVSLRFWQTAERHTSDTVVLDVPWDVLRRTLPPAALPHRSLIARLRTVVRRLSERLRPPLKPVTVMEAVTVLQPSDERPTKEAFERCLALAIEVTRSYRLSQRLMTRYPTVERLPFLVPYMVRTLTTPTAWEGPFMYLLHYNTPSAHEFELPGREEMDRFGFFFEAIRNGNPMVTYSDQGMEARIAFGRNGDYSNAVTHAQTSLEALFDNLLTLLLWEEGFDPV